jgi:hypothetical protein
MNPMPEAVLILRTRDAYAGGVLEIVVWAVPEPVPPSDHGFKYRLVFAREGERVVGYDNERGKGDHRHLGAVEKPYEFVDVPTLLADFMRDVEDSK